MPKKKLRYSYRGRPSGHKVYEFVNSKGQLLRLPGSMTMEELVRAGISPHLGEKGAPPTETVFVPHPWFDPSLGRCTACGKLEPLVGLSTMCGDCRGRYIYDEELLCDLCHEPVTCGSVNVVSGRPRHPDCIPF